MFVDEKNNLNHTLEIDSPFQTFAVGLLVEFIDLLYRLGTCLGTERRHLQTRLVECRTGKK